MYETSLPKRFPPVLGFRFSDTTAAGAAEAILSTLRTQGEGVGLVTTPNLDHVVQKRTNRDLVASYDLAAIMTCDGFPLRYYARVHGYPVPHVTGCEITAEIMRRPTFTRENRLFFVVDSETTTNAVMAWAAARGIADQVATAIPPFGFEHNADYSVELTKAIAAHDTTVLMMGVGAPKSEVFVYRNRHALTCWAVCVGQAIKIEVGLAQRAPPLARTLGAEWLWRMLREPRLARRYAMCALVFPLAVLGDLVGGGQKENVNTRACATDADA